MKLRQRNVSETVANENFTARGHALENIIGIEVAVPVSTSATILYDVVAVVGRVEDEITTSDLLRCGGLFVALFSCGGEPSWSFLLL